LNSGRDSELRRISIFDSTLRDGEQAPGNAMTPDQKLEVALAIEALGVDVIETGFPSSSPSDYKATQLIAESVTTARIATLNRAARDDIRQAIEAGGTRNHHVQIMATGSEVHLEHKRGIGQDEAQAEVIDAIKYAKSLGAEHITLGVEDSSRGSDALLRPLCEESVEAGCDVIGLADTTGCMTPGEYGALVARVRSWVGPDVVLATHCHEDLGLSLANALAGIQAGADEVQATLAGIGERAGNTPLEELIAVLTYKGEAIGATTTATSEGLYAAYQVLARCIGLVQPRNKAIFGVNAFATQAGIHQAGMLRAPITYEYVEPHRFGRERAMLVGRHSGRAVLRYVFDQLEAEVDEDIVGTVYEEHVANRTNGECTNMAELKDIIASKLELV
jgi:2-isopropylmalate synthase